MQKRSLKRAILACAAALVASAAGATDLSNSVAGSVSDSAGSLPYRLFEPQNVEAGQKVPLILFLHGLGDGGTDNVGQTYWMNNLQQQTKSGHFAAYVLAPQLPKNVWGGSSTSTPTNNEVLTMDALNDVIKSLPSNVDTSRVYLTGVSMGSFEAYDLLSKNPGVFAAALPMSGAPSTNIAPLLTSTPIWAFHAADDPVVPVSTTQNMIDAINADGGNAKFTELDTGGHYIWPGVYDDPSVYSWLFDQSLGGFAVASSAASNVAAVPEPTAMGLFAIAGVAMLRRKRIATP